MVMQLWLDDNLKSRLKSLPLTPGVFSKSKTIYLLGTILIWIAPLGGIQLIKDQLRYISLSGLVISLIIIIVLIIVGFLLRGYSNSFIDQDIPKAGVGDLVHLLIGHLGKKDYLLWEKLADGILSRTNNPSADLMVLARAFALQTLSFLCFGGQVHNDQKNTIINELLNIINILKSKNINSPSLVQWEGLASEMIGEKQNAINYYQEYLKMNPNDRNIKANLESLMQST
jgi:hypothetical protein